MIRFKSTLAILLITQIGQSFSLQAQELPVVVLDTLNWSQYKTGTDTLYESPNGGYVFGNNGYGDIAKGQAFTIPYFSKLEKVLFKFGAKKFNSLNPNSKVNVGFYKLDGEGTDANGASLDAPGSELAHVDSIQGLLRFSGSIFVSDIDTSGGFTELDLSGADTANFTYNSFAVVIYVSDLADGDTLGLMSTIDGDAGMNDNAWDRHSNGEWVSVLNHELGWNLDVDLGIFPVIKYDNASPVGIREVDSGIQVFPNPATSNFTVSNENGIEKDFSLFHLDGRLVKQIEPVRVNRNKVVFDVDGLANGTYILKSYGPRGLAFTKVQVIH